MAKTRFIFFLLLSLGTIGCNNLPPGRHPAEQVVEEMYMALDVGDMDSYMDTMLPQNRRLPNPVGLLTALDIYAGPVAVTVGLEQLSYQEIKVHLIHETGSYVLVQAEGHVRYPPLLWELPFCEQHDVRLSDGAWYIDIYAPEREKRIQQVMEQKMQELETAPPLDDDIAGLVEGIIYASETMLDLCLN